MSVSEIPHKAPAVSENNNFPDIVLTDGTPSNNPMVTKAIAFLTHPAVTSHKVEDKVKFLRKKGLQEQDIQSALKATESASNSFAEEFSPSVVVRPPLFAEQDSFRQRLLDYQSVGTFCLVLGGITYACFRFYKGIIEPFMFPERRRTQEFTMVSFLEKNDHALKQMNATLEKILFSLESQQFASTGIQASVRELKQELASVKSLFLSRMHFPAANLPSGVPPSIPSWQIKGNSSGDGRKEENRKSSRNSGQNASSRRIESGGNHSGNSSEESLEIIPPGGNRGAVQAEYPVSSPSPPVDEEHEDSPAGDRKTNER
ncbi:unnamed protein product [Notodromas monacha]|uniref:Peroxisomal membrane protein PEX14 n=1 Tax=Notodromas monacha TaxID=399045 RepID=A0A7R9BSU7_9CRUS|nr:unnamed protein product [Notodromas monacha]CAG0920029.1 unnamed protein product [Notodromas monacha]